MGKGLLLTVSSFKLLCYYLEWSAQSFENIRFYPENIDPYLCTHLVFSPGTRTDQVTEWKDEPLYKKFNDLKDKNKKLKTLLQFGIKRFTDMATTRENRERFISAIIIFLRKQRFDGLDLDWRLPAHRGSSKHDKQHFTFLAKELFEAFEAEAETSGQDRLLLTAAVASNKKVVDWDYEVAEMSQYLDLISVMTFNFHGVWNAETGHNSPLYRGSEDYGPQMYFNIEYILNYWRDKGAPAEKLLVGFPTYANSYTLKTSQTGVGAPVSGGGDRGPYTVKPGFLSYSEVCLFLKNATIKFIDDQKVPYAFQGNQWVGYDDQQSFTTKAQWVKDNNFGGAMLWALNLDDYSGSYCNQGSYPLAKTLKAVLNTVSSFKLLCYYLEWSAQSFENIRFSPENIDPYLCTHLVFSPGTRTDQVTEWKDEPLYKKFNDLKDKNKNLKTLLQFGIKRFTDMATTRENRERFISAIIIFLRKQRFDGLDLDWRLPAHRGSSKHDKQHFTFLAKELFEAFEAEAETSGQDRLLLTAAVASNKKVVDWDYEVAEMSQYLDLISVMTFNFHGVWNAETGHNSPLYRGSEDYGPQMYFNIEYILNYWRDKGAPAEKLLVGFPTHANSYTLKTSQTGVGAPVSGGGDRGPYTVKPGFLSYSEVCLFLKNATIKFIDDQKVPYAFQGNQWVGYDDQQSFTTKAQWVKDNNFGGAMLWALNLDDYSGSYCNQGSYPLTKTLKAVLNTGNSVSSFKLLCYYLEWSAQSFENIRFSPENIDPYLCTHLVFSPGTRTDQVTEWKDEPLYKKFNDLKDKNKKLKTLLQFGIKRFADMATTRENRERFISAIIIFLRKQRFDGLDLDWRLPAHRGSSKHDKQHFTFLAKELFEAFEAEAETSGQDRLLLTAAVASNKKVVDWDYEVAEISQYLDLISVMTFNFHGVWNAETGHNSPLYRGSEDYGPQMYFNIEYILNYWRDKGAPAEKLLVGFPTYANSYTLKTSQTGVGAPVSGGGDRGPYTVKPGFLSYSEVCLFLKNATIKFIDDQKVPYAFQGNQWVGYDDQQSFTTKAQWVKDNNFGGAMLWALNLDDYSGSYCNQGPYPLAKTLKAVLNTGRGNAGAQHRCSGKPNGFYPIPNAPGKFYNCDNRQTEMMNCAAPLTYDHRCHCCLQQKMTTFAIE
ncbi:probable chitinase 10 isoform X3 [Scyliorhinus torazame]|uniref:probable chitinase 10 isoform X3 n=1 Tax=Scyliorhinus torazame TaxID=75743 RepID=UPI003B5AC62B